MEGSSTSSSDQVKNIDWISKLPDDVLLSILLRLSTEEAIRTSVVSKRWKHVWMEISHLGFDMPRIINSTEPLDGSNRVATLMTKVINSHRRHLESSVINHFSHQGVDGMLNTWIRLMTCVKHTKSLTLEHHWVPKTKPFNIASDSFSHPSLSSLSLHSYILRSSHPFRNCSNLRTLKLLSILAPEVGVFNRVLASCPSLEVLVLRISCVNKGGGPLKIENNKLKLLKVSSTEYIDGIEVSATCLDILVIQHTSVKRVNFLLQSPKLKFNRNFWVTEGPGPHISYNISEEEKNFEHEELVNIFGQVSRPNIFALASLSVSIDLTNPTEVERLRQVLSLWTHTMMELEIIFKDSNAPREENESWHKKLWMQNNNKDVFPNAKFRVRNVWMYNFSGSDEEFALASCLIRQRTVENKMMIKISTSFTPRKTLQVETAVVNKLYALRREHQRQLIIKCI